MYSAPCAQNPGPRGTMACHDKTPGRSMRFNGVQLYESHAINNIDFCIFASKKRSQKGFIKNTFLW